MQIGPKLLDYAIVGVFFIFLHLIIFLVIIFYIPDLIDGVNFSAILIQIGSKIPEYLQSAIAGILATFAIISVFAIGLIIDLVGNISISNEVSQFGNELHRNKRWVFRIFKNNRKYFGRNYEEMLRFLIKTKNTRENFSFSNMKIFISIKRWKTEFIKYKFVKTYARLLDFIIAYTIYYSNSRDISILLDQLRIWKLSKSLSVAAQIFMMEMMVVGFIVNNTIFLFIISMFNLPIVIFVGLVSIKTYSRTCRMLFAFAYIADMNRDASDTTDPKNL